MGEYDGPAQMTFSDFVIQSLARIHAVTTNENKSYQRFAHRSAIEQLWHSIPSDKKKKFEADWAKVRGDIGKLREIVDHEQRQDRAIELNGQLMQVLTDCLDGNNLLFKAPNSTKEAWRRAAREKAAGGGKE